MDVDAAEAWRGEVEAFARRLPGAVTVSVLDPEPPPVRTPEPSDASLPALAARTLRRPLRRIRSLTSFSALWAEAATSAAGAGDRAPAGRDEAEIDRPDHDQHEAPADATGDPSGAGGASATRPPRRSLQASKARRRSSRRAIPRQTAPGQRSAICEEAMFEP